MSAVPSMIFAVPELLTIDATVAFDYIDGTESRHALAVELVERTRRGQVEFAAAPQGYRLDLSRGRAQSIAEVRAAFAREGVRQARQVARVSEATFPGPDLICGHHVEGFAEACEEIAQDWTRAPGGADRFHVETHLADLRDVFITPSDSRIHLFGVADTSRTPLECVLGGNRTCARFLPKGRDCRMATADAATSPRTTSPQPFANFGAAPPAQRGSRS